MLSYLKIFLFFCSIVDFDKQRLKDEIMFDLQYSIFRVDNLLPAFKTLYGGRNFSTNSEFIRKLQEIELFLFSLKNRKIYQFPEGEKEAINIENYNYSMCVKYY